MNTRLLAALIPALLSTSACIKTIPTSKLWGNSGEMWTPSSRLPDFSFAGYKSSDAPIPDLRVVSNVRSHGAKGNGKTDDTKAFIAAIEACHNGAVLIPPGDYVITDQLLIARKNTVLRGAGTEKTILRFPKSLSDMVGPGKDFAPGGAWSWSGGVISFNGANSNETLTAITANEPRGTDTVTVASTKNLRAGQHVRVRQLDPDGSLARNLHAGHADGTTQLKGKTLIDFSCTIKTISDKTVRLNRPLRLDIDTQWKPALLADQPTVENVGIENLTLIFPSAPYAGHHVEPGFNGVAFENIANGWVRNLHVINSDAGVLLRDGTKFCTVQHVTFSAEPGRSVNHRIGHHGILISGLSQDNLIDDFHFQGKFIHDLCVTTLAYGNVFMNGQGEDLTMDHHRKAPSENLFTNIDAGQGSELWLSGGDADAGPPSAARETFWNIRASTRQKLPSWALQFNFIGINSSAKRDDSGSDNWIENIAPDQLIPRNLFEAQLQNRHK